MCCIGIAVTLCEFYNSMRVCKRPPVADPAWLFEGGSLQGFIVRDSNILPHHSEVSKDEVMKVEWQRGLCSAGVLSRAVTAAGESACG